MISDSDVKWVYAAYKKGAFPDIQEGMDGIGFRSALLEHYDRMGGEMWILAAPNDVSSAEGAKPVGLIQGQVTAHVVEPHVYWFPWATPRNKVETILKYLAGMRFRAVVLVHASETDAVFFDHIAAYQVLRRIGTIHNYYGMMENAVLYQTKGFTGEAL